MNEDIKTSKMVIYGEGAVHPPFLGSVYIKDDRESQDQAERRVNEAMTNLGFAWLPKNQK